MNILMLSTDYLPNIGGISNHVYELSNALSKLGNNIVVVTSYNGGIKKRVEQINENFIVYRVPIINIPKLSGLTRYVGYKNLINKLIKQYNIDIIHNHCLGTDSLVLKSIKNVKRVFTNHSSTFLYLIDNNKLNEAKNQINHYDFIIAPSDELKESSERCGIDKNIIKFIPNGVDINRFNNLDQDVINGIKIKLNLDKNELNIICARRPVIKNGVKYLVKAVKELIKENYNIKLFIVGDTPDNEISEKNEIVNIIKEFSLEKQIVMCGSVNRDEIPYYYKAADISVLPSLKEAISLTALESMAAELPVIASNVGGLPQIIKDGYNGYLFEAKNVAQLKEKIINIYNSRKLVDVFGKNGFEFVYKYYSWNKVAQDTLEVYDKILNN